MLLNRIFNHFIEKRRLEDLALEEEERLKEEKYQKRMDMIHYLENGGVELELHKLVYRFLANEKLWKEPFRLSENKIGIFFHFDDVSYAYPFNRNYYHGGIGLILKKREEKIEFRVVALKRTISSVNYGHTSHTSSRLDVTNQSKYDFYTTLPYLFEQDELSFIWDKISVLIETYDDF